MNTHSFGGNLKVAHDAGRAARRRSRQNAELREFASAGMMVFTGLILAALYGLLTHQIPI